MKQILLLLLTLTLLMSCGNAGEKDDEANAELLKDEHAIVDTINLLHTSQLKFDDALIDIKANKKMEAAVALKKAVTKLKAEKENMRIARVKEKMGQTIDNIQVIADSLEDGKDIAVKLLKKNISKAELLLARHYFVNIEMPEAIDKTYVAMDKTAELLEAGLVHNDDDNVKQDAGTIVNDTRVLLQKAKDNREQHKEELKKHAERIKAFLEKNAK